MPTSIYFLAPVVVILILRHPYIGIALIFTLVSFQGLIGDWLESSELFFGFLGLTTAVSYFFSLATGRSTTHFQISLNGILILIFAFYILISNPDAALDQPNRNWFSTYIQLFALVFLIENIMTREKEVLNFMFVFSLGSILFVVNIIRTLSENGYNGILEGANIYSRAFIIAILFTYFLYKNATRHKNLLLILILIQCAGMILTQSRTGIFLLFLSMIFILYKDYRMSLRNVAIMFLCGMIVYLAIPEELIQSIGADFAGRGQTDNPKKIDYSSIDNNIRYVLWGIGYDLWQNSNVFFGIGIGQFSIDIKSYFPYLESGIGLHNTYLSVLFETGIFGFTIFIAFIIRALLFYVHVSSDEDDVGIATIWLMCFIALLIGGLTKHDHFDKLLFGMVGMSYFFHRRIDFQNEEN